MRGLPLQWPCLSSTHIVFLGFSMALIHIFFLLSSLVSLAQQAELADYVFTNTGSEGGGNTFPGVSEPFGMVKLGPDVFQDRVDSYSGYLPNGKIKAFSMLHLSGTGGAPKYGVVAQMPVVGNIANPLDDYLAARDAPDMTEVGYYKSRLATGITVELAASSRAGMLQYTFPSGPTPRNVIVDVSHVLPSYRGQGLGQRYLGGSISVDRDDSGNLQYKGSGSYDNGWNRAPKWTVYFCGAFNSSATFKTFVGTNATANTLSKFSNDNKVESLSRLGAVFTFDAANVVSRVGVSFISEDQACTNLDQQIPESTSISQLRQKTRDVWNTDVLSRVASNDKNTTKLQHLYTSMYFMHLMPINKTGENPEWKSTEPYYDDIFTLWDLFRCTSALLHVFQPKVYEEFIRSLIDTWRHEGYLPDARSSFFNGATQGGSNADTVLADAYVKGVRGQINWEDGFAAMVKDAEVVPALNDDPRDKTGSTKEGRGALPDWKERGFLSTKFERSVSRAVEYSQNDFGLSQVAKGLGKTAEAEKYMKRSRQWRSHWNKDMKALGFSGFLGPKGEDGQFEEQDPLNCRGCYWGDNSLPWEYTFGPHHDISTLIDYSGGPRRFASRLQWTFEPNVRPKGHERFNRMIFDPGNEPSFTTPYLYNFVGRQDMTVNTTRYLGKTYYGVRPNGLPGNSDAGAMESWILWVMLGLYPMTGQTTFLIGSPWLDDITISLGDGKSLQITSTGGSEDSFYVQSLKVNGKNWTKTWVTWDDIFAKGGKLEFTLGPEPSNFGATSPESPPPPSPASEYKSGETYMGNLGGYTSNMNSGGHPSWLIPVAVTVPIVVVAAFAICVTFFFIRRRRAAAAQKALSSGSGTPESGIETLTPTSQPVDTSKTNVQVEIVGAPPLDSTQGANIAQLPPPVANR
ncbi:hypothetical protein MCOR16_005332 [Pyricularia oryzae]|nr:hypothetical protein MCOR16_005332 [Pyricularia oryzae]